MLQSARHLRAIALVAALVSASMIAACDDDDDEGTDPDTQETFAVTMNGANERPTPVTNSTATGTATLSFTGSGPVTFTINVTGLSGAATLAHIHGPATTSEANTPIVTFTGLSTNVTGQLVTGTFSTTGVATVSMDSLKVLLRNGHAYINVHTALNPNGEIRGQIVEN